MIKEEKVFVYSTDSEGHKFNIGEDVEEGLNTLGLIQNKDGSWEIDESLMWNGEFDEYEWNLINSEFYWIIKLK